MSQSKPSQPKQNGNFFGNMLFNIIIPVVILTKFSGDEHLGATFGLVAALSFPIGFGLWELVKVGKINPFSILGIISVLLTGGISLLELDPKYIAIKEAAIPGLIGIAVIISQNTRFPLLKTLFFNEQIIALDKVHEALDKNNAEDKFKVVMARSSYIVAFSFFLSSALNYILAKTIVVAQPGTQTYNEQIGEMTALSYPVIVIPSLIVLLAAIWYLIAQLKKLTGLKVEDIMAEQPSKKEANS